MIKNNRTGGKVIFHWIQHDAKELTRKAQDLVALYEAHLSENPNDVNALIPLRKIPK